MRNILRSISVLLALIMCATCGLAEDFIADIQQYMLTHNADSLFNADLVIGYLAADGTRLNPFVCNERDVLSINQLVFESLVELNAERKPVPLLADSWSVDGKTWKFKLRTGITFHTGDELVAEDVVASYNMFLQTASENPYAARLNLIEGMAATDVFELTVVAKYEGMITLYAMTFPVVQRYTTTETLARGTGPYWYIQYAQDTAIRLERNPLWWKEQPKVESIAAIRYVDTGDALQALQTGYIDALSSRSPTAAFSKKLANLTSMDYTTCTYEYLVPNLRAGKSPLSDLAVRKAIMYAIDRSTLVLNQYLDMGQQSEVPIVPGSWIYETQSAVYYYSPERAMQLLNEAGWSDLTGDAMLNKLVDGMLVDLEVRIVTYLEETTFIRQYAIEQIAKNLNAVGIKTTTSVLSRSSMADALDDGKFDLALIAVNLSEVPNMAYMFARGGDLNFSGSGTDAMNEILARTLTAVAEEDFKLAYSDLQMYIVNNLPILGLLFRTGSLLSTRSLGGLAGLREFDAYNGIEFMEK